MECIDQNGCVFFPVRSNQNEDSRSGESSDLSSGANGVFSIQSDDDKITITNCYYNVGGILNKANDTDVTSLIAGTGILAFDHKAGRVVFFSSLDTLKIAQQDASNYVIALYMVDEDGNVMVDFRNAPQIQFFEEGLT